MMSQVKNWSKIALCSLFLAALVGCKGNEPVDPYVTPGTTDDPQWKVTVENDMTSSMTAIVRVNVLNPEGILAAFMDTTCCGIAEYNAEYDLYWLYISPATEEGGKVQLRFYSPKLRRIYDATQTVSFLNDAILGTVANPYTPNWSISN